jgi:ATP-dependent DNA helicase RecG
MSLFQPLHNLPGISLTNSKLLKNLEIHTILDLLFYYPRDYIKYRRVRIANLKVGDNVTIIGIIKKHEIISPAKNPKLTIQTWTIKDKTGSITCKRFYNHPYYQSQRWRCEQSKLYSTTRFVAVSGIVKDDSYLGKTLNNPEIRVVELADIKAKSSSIIPIYTLTKGVTLELVQNAIQTALTVINQLKDPLPAYVRQQYGLIRLKKAIANIHFPLDSKILAGARRRLVFDEFFYLQLSLLQRRHLFKARASISKSLLLVR